MKENGADERHVWLLTRDCDYCEEREILGVYATAEAAKASVAGEDEDPEAGWYQAGNAWRWSDDGSDLVIRRWTVGR